MDRAGDPPILAHMLRLPTSWSLLLCAACQTGGQTGGELATNGSQCDETTTTVGIDELSPLGFSAREALAAVEGRHEVTTEWLVPTPPFTELESSAIGQADVSLQLQWTSGEVRYVESGLRMVKPKPGEAIVGIAIDEESACPDRVEVDVDATLESSDGALQEVAEGTVVARRPWVADVMVPLDAGALGGSLNLELPASSGTEIKDFAFAAQVGEGLFRGSLRGTVQEQSKEIFTAALFELLRFGPDVCELNFGGDMPVPLDGGMPTTRDLLDIVNTHEPFALTWSDGRQTTLTLEAETEATWACQGRFLFSTILNARVHATTEDGSVDTVLDVELHGRPSNGAAFQEVELVFQAYMGKGVPPSDFEGVFGVHGVDVTGYDKVTVSLSSTYGTTTFGKLEVIGIVEDCSSSNCFVQDAPVLQSATW